MRKALVPTVLAAAFLLAVAGVADARGGGGGGGGGGGHGGGGGRGGGGSWGGGGGSWGGGHGSWSGGGGSWSGGGGSWSGGGGSWSGSRGGSWNGGSWNGGSNGWHGGGSWNGGWQNTGWRGGSWHAGGSWNGGWRGGCWNCGGWGWRGGWGWNAGWWGPWGGWWGPAWGTGWWGPTWGVAVGSTWPWWGTTAVVAPVTTVVTPTASAWDTPMPSGQIVRREPPPASAPPTGSAGSPMVRLFCSATQAFYPDVTTCAVNWTQVLPGPGNAPLPQQAPPQSGAPQSFAPQPDALSGTRTYPAGAPYPAVPQQRGYDVKASSSSPYVPVAGSSGDLVRPARAPSATADSMPAGASTTPPERAETPGTAASGRPRVIPAPRAEPPRRPSPVTLVAQMQAD